MKAKLKIAFKKRMEKRMEKLSLDEKYAYLRDLENMTKMAVEQELNAKKKIILGYIQELVSKEKERIQH